MTQAEIKEAAHKNTGRVAEQNGSDADFLLLACIQEICGLARFYWRKKAFSFSTVASTATYDLTSSSYANISDFDELIGLWRFDSATSYAGMGILGSDEEILAAIADSTTGDPTAYCAEPGSSETVRLSPVPSSAKTMRGLYWAIPSALDSSSGGVPLIPSRWHYVLVKRLEISFLDTLKKTETVLADIQAKTAEYQQGAALMVKNNRFSTKEVRRFVSPDDAVTST